ncbi:MAG: pyridoxamine 5'-phosphate oxidase [Planctomycetaceae bacterium]|nr:pyridoxamine 5'-phosphate oxidase [Planctomycetaceae bacterium]
MPWQNEYLHESDFDDNPFVVFEQWFAAASDAGIAEPNAMCLATATESEIASRMVLMKYWDATGFVFFTNYGSRKAKQLDERSRVALLFYWEKLHRQVRIEGTASRTTTAESLKYFLTRPRGSQLGAWCSEQSTAISTRAVLTEKLEEMKRKFAKGEVPLPTKWGGYRVAPYRIEFWQHGENRLHDRFVYERQMPERRWQRCRLAP